MKYRALNRNSKYAIFDFCAGIEERHQRQYEGCRLQTQNGASVNCLPFNSLVNTTTNPGPKPTGVPQRMTRVFRRISELWGQRLFPIKEAKPKRNSPITSTNMPTRAVYAIVACDFVTVVTVCFRMVYVFVALEIGSRRLIHFNATEHPTAEWTLQQLREGLPEDREYRFLLHDRYKTFSLG